MILSYFNSISKFLIFSFIFSPLLWTYCLCNCGIPVTTSIFYRFILSAKEIAGYKVKCNYNLPSWLLSMLSQLALSPGTRETVFPTSASLITSSFSRSSPCFSGLFTRAHGLKMDISVLLKILPSAMYKLVRLNGKANRLSYVRGWKQSLSWWPPDGKGFWGKGL